MPRVNAVKTKQVRRQTRAKPVVNKIPIPRTRRHQKPTLVAIVGGSGSGKTWLCERLQTALAPHALQISLDDFYRDRSHIENSRRGHLNFDHPKAIDWQTLEQALERLLAGRSAAVPCYDFRTHCRLPQQKNLKPKPILLLEGLWPLRRRSVRRLISFSIYLDCPKPIRLQRRIARDKAVRGRSRVSVQRQFQQTVEPMHALYVAPQAALANVVFKKNCSRPQIRSLAKVLRGLSCVGERRNPTRPDH